MRIEDGENWASFGDLVRGVWGNRAVIVETSTNLVDWEKVGAAKLCGDCAYEFDDAQTPAVGARYYRVVSPK